MANTLPPALSGNSHVSFTYIPQTLLDRRIVKTALAVLSSFLSATTSASSSSPSLLLSPDGQRNGGVQRGSVLVCCDCTPWHSHINPHRPPLQIQLDILFLHIHFPPTHSPIHRIPLASAALHAFPPGSQTSHNQAGRELSSMRRTGGRSSRLSSFWHFAPLEIWPVLPSGGSGKGHSVV